MKKNPLYYFTILALLYVVGAVFNGQAIYNQSKLYAKDKLDYVDVLNFEDRLLNIEEWIFTGSGWDDKDLISKGKLKSSEMDYAVEKKYSYCFIAGSLSFIVIVLIIFWGGNPAESHPRHFTKYSLMPKGEFIPNGRKDRTAVLIDVRKTKSAKAANQFLQIKPRSDFELAWALRGLAKGLEIDPKIEEKMS
jgi:hypothetical protein